MTQPLFSRQLALVLGTLGSIVLAGSAFIPAPFSIPAALVGFLLASLAGLGARPPAIAIGNPVLQGAALTIATTLLTIGAQFYNQIPLGWPQSLAMFGVGMLSWLTGRALPNLTPPEGAAPMPLASAPTVMAKPDAISVLQKGPNP